MEGIANRLQAEALPAVAWLRQEIRRLGEARLAMLVLLAGAAMVGLLVVLAWADLARLRALTSGAVTTVVAKTEAPAQDRNQQRLDNFYAVLPPASAAPDVIDELFALGKRQGVLLQRGDYRIDAGDGQVLRMHLRFPAVGEGNKIERFVWEVLKRFPALALEGVTFQRESDAVADSEVEIRFVLFMQATDVAPTTKVARQ